MSAIQIMCFHKIMSVWDHERLSRLSIAENPRFSARNILFLMAISRHPDGWVSVDDLSVNAGYNFDIHINSNPLKFAINANLCEHRKDVGGDGREIVQVRVVPGAFQCVPIRSMDGQSMLKIFSSLRSYLGEHPFCSPLVCLLLAAVYVRQIQNFKLILRHISNSSHSSSIKLMANDLVSYGCLKIEKNICGLSLYPT